MTVVDRDAAQASAIQIRDETGTALNTATRVGTAFLNLADSCLFSGAAADLEDRTITVESVGTGAAAGLVIHNPTAAGVGAPQYSPGLVLQGEGWETTGGTRREVYARPQVRGIQGASVVPQWALALGSAAEGTTPDAASLTTRLVFDQTQLTLTTDPAFIVSFAGFVVLKTQSGNDLIIGSAGNGPETIVLDTLDNTGTISLNIGGVTGLLLDETTADFQDNAIVTTGNLDLGIASKIRFGATPIDAIFADGSDNLLIGKSGANGVTAIGYDVKTGGSHIFRVNAVDQLTIGGTTVDAQNNDIVTTGNVTAANLVASANLALGAASVITFDSTPTGTPIAAMFTDTAENLYLGSAGANGATSIIYNVKTGGAHSFFVNGVGTGTHNENGLFLNGFALELSAGVNVNARIIGNGEAMIGLNIAASGVRNLALFNDGSAGMQSMDGGVYIANAVAAPTGNPSSGGYLYVEAGELKYRGPSGAITSVGAA
jgi:hypothetical protein